MSRAVVGARKPTDVAREVEVLRREGCRSFAVSRIDHGGMLDLERLGAARYAAGLQSLVELEEETPAPVAASR